MTATSVAPRSPLESLRWLRGPRRFVIAAAVALAIVLLVVPVLLQQIQARAMRAQIESHEVARESLSRVRSAAVLLHQEALVSSVGGSVALDAASGEMDAALAGLVAATAAPPLRPAGEALVAAMRADQADFLARARRGDGASADRLASVARLVEGDREVGLAIAAAEEEWVARSNALGLAAAVAHATAGLGLLGLLARESFRRHRGHEAQARRMSHIVEAVADAVIVRDPSGRITDWNDRAAALYGYTREEVLGRGDLPETLGDVLPFDAVMRRMEERGELLARRLVRRRKDGALVHVDVSAFLLLDDHGKAIGTYSFSVDVTAAVRAAEALHRSEAYLRSVLDSSAIGIGAAIIAADGTIAFANAEFERVAPEALGLGGRSMIGARVAGALDAEDEAGAPRWAAAVRAGLGGTISSAEFPVGEERWMRVDGAPVWDEEGQHPGMILILRDVTRARLDEERASAAEGRAAAIFQAAPIGLLVLDERGHIEEVNAAASDITGFPASMLVGRSGAMLADITDEQLRTFIDRSVEGLEVGASGRGGIVAHPDRVELRHRDGHAFPASLQVGVLSVRDRASGRMERKFLCAIADVSPQVATEREARRVERMQALNTLVGGVAHDFNNLLTVIAGGIDIARSGSGDPAEWLERSAVASAQAAGLVRQLLRYSRPETDALGPVRFDEAVRETVSLVRATFDRRLVVHFEGAPGEVTVHGNRSQLDQVVMNLLVNARDAVLARLEDEAQASAGAYVPSIAISLRPDAADATRVVFVVRDNGIGIAAPVIDQVFDPFFTTKGPDRGTGLGLATVYSIVRAHGGEVTVESEVGFGTEFSVRLPIEPDGATAAPASTDGVAPAGLRGRVLVVDDEEPVARIAQRALTAAGMEVTVALDGHTAVGHCRDQMFDVILLDLNMPRPDGGETLVRLRAAAPRTPVIIVSGRLGAVEIAETAGVGFLAKPYVYTHLVERVATLIEARTLA